MKSVSGSAVFTLYNHLVHCSRFPENICSTQKKTKGNSQHILHLTKLYYYTGRTEEYWTEGGVG